MLDFIATIATTTAIVTVLVALLSAMQITPKQRLVAAIVLGLWIGLGFALAASGQFDDAGKRPIQLIGVMYLAPLIVVALIAAFSPGARRAMLSIPLPLMVGLHVLRVIGGGFLLLAIAGRLSGPFPTSAGWGDLVAAVLAIPAAYLAMRKTTDKDWLISAWNYIGALDLFLAIVIGTITGPGSTLQLIDAGVGSRAMLFLPWAIIPAVIAPYLLISHGIIYAQLRARARR